MTAAFKVSDWKPGDEFSAAGYWYSNPVLYKGRIEQILEPMAAEVLRIKYREIKAGDNHDTVRELQEMYVSAAGLLNEGVMLFKSGREALAYLEACYQTRYVAAKALVKKLKDEYHRVLGFEIPLEIVERWLT